MDKKEKGNLAISVSVEKIGQFSKLGTTTYFRNFWDTQRGLPEPFPAVLTKVIFSASTLQKTIDFFNRYRYCKLPNRK